MAQLDLQQKLAILADAAKYDASCASSGTSKRDSRGGKGIGSTEGMGICHAYAPDGRCISLLKILLTNSCIFDCHYCINRKSSNVRRARFTAEEVVRLTLAFYRRNYIEGLFLSSGIIRSPDYTMEQIVEVARSLREDHDFQGYIHLKTIPDADPELVRLAGVHADRVSINVELPTAAGLARLAPEKDGGRIEGAMKDMRTAIDDRADAKKRYNSAFSPIPDASAVLPLQRPPLMREHRLYQSDWLMRFYGYSPTEVASAADPAGMLPLDIDPKLAWALKFRESFPVDVNRAPREALLRVPGLGVKAVDKLIKSRRWRRLRLDDVARLTVSIAKVRPFICAEGWSPIVLTDRSDLGAWLKPKGNQLELFA